MNDGTLHGAVSDSVIVEVPCVTEWGCSCGLVGEPDGQRGISSLFIHGKCSNRGYGNCSNGDVTVLRLHITANSIRNGKFHGIGAGILVGERRVLGRAVPCAIIGEVPCIREGSSTRSTGR